MMGVVVAAPLLLLCTTTWKGDGFGADLRGNRGTDGVVYVYCSTHVKLEEEAKREKKARGRGNWINPRPSSGIRKRPRGFVRRARKRREEPNSPLFLPPLACVATWGREGGAMGADGLKWVYFSGGFVLRDISSLCYFYF